MLIRLLSINIWDLPVPLPGFARGVRRQRLLEQLGRCNADLVLVQEAFLPDFKPRLAEALTGLRPDDYLAHRRRQFFITMDRSGGLTTLSRLEVAGCGFGRFPLWRRMKPDERIGRKGVLWTRLRIPGGQLIIGNAHLYAGTTPADARVRAMQTRHLLHQLRGLPEGPAIIAGDFNMTTDYEMNPRGPTGFDLMREAGFTEVANGVTGDIATMSPRRNPYARYSSFGKPERRLTQVFYRGAAIRLAEPPALCLHDPPVSDHYGLITGLSLD